MAKEPTSATIRTYHVGFGDCFLVSFEYSRKSERHVLIDFGSTGFPKGVPKSRMMDIAKNIKQRTGGKLHAVVATHRHRDHISGFATEKAGKGTGDVIRSLKPDLVVQPWTEDPKLGPKATGPGASNAKIKKFGTGTSEQIAALSLMHALAHQSLAARNLPKNLRGELGFLGESNIANPSAVKNLMKMAKNSYEPISKLPTAVDRITMSNDSAQGRAVGAHPGSFSRGEYCRWASWAQTDSDALCARS